MALRAVGATTGVQRVRVAATASADEVARNAPAEEDAALEEALAALPKATSERLSGA